MSPPSARPSPQPQVAKSATDLMNVLDGHCRPGRNMLRPSPPERAAGYGAIFFSGQTVTYVMHFSTKRYLDR